MDDYLKRLGLPVASSDEANRIAAQYLMDHGFRPSPQRGRVYREDSHFAPGLTPGAVWDTMRAILAGQKGGFRSVSR